MTLLRSIPAIDQLLNDERSQKVIDQEGVPLVTLKSVFQEVTEDIRSTILNNQALSTWSEDNLYEVTLSYAFETLETKQRKSLQSVINATGTIIHTNLGRSRLADTATDRVTEVAKNYSTLEYDLTTGRRGSRHDLVEERIKALTGAEAAIVVNNNAAAVFLVLSALAQDEEVIVSRGELVEIGGSFRVSEIMEETGAILHEVGTTNKTHLSDYQKAISEATRMIMKVHQSNFYMGGFTASVNRQELQPLTTQHDVVLYEDLGSGLLYNLSEHGISDEPTVQQVIASGVDLVSFSVDKLLGGPQAGIIAGKKDYIDQLRSHSLNRILRVDKMTYAALDETLRLFEAGSYEEIPTLGTVLKNDEQIKRSVQSLIRSLPSLENINVSVEQTSAQVGGGTLPEVTLPSYSLVMTFNEANAAYVTELLRLNQPAIIARVENEKVYLDFRTVDSNEHDAIILAISNIDQLI
ncbi:L-seryl-tRNA(Sec) selenium transferase [Alkalibacillus almallahensis]|uniref:L-seryl-tRNA(Sec) selenium transferase n=1 Tax=Alkalibacillus almallahensis TaxID=1379154 RepID=UPI00141FF15F|nr:L-seryl-tRNA(Sec) selenium transferase [Alkalibacillus almallahensis]NIK10962.1 L-seryl-tRNA(Ser) seleniumtransferase [Alkalibacillus almallahensis]